MWFGRWKRNVFARIQKVVRRVRSQGRWRKRCGGIYRCRLTTAAFCTAPLSACNPRSCDTMAASASDRPAIADCTRLCCIEKQAIRPKVARRKVWNRAIIPLLSMECDLSFRAENRLSFSSLLYTDSLPGTSSCGMEYRENEEKRQVPLVTIMEIKSCCTIIIDLLLASQVGTLVCHVFGHLCFDLATRLQNLLHDILRMRKFIWRTIFLFKQDLTKKVAKNSCVNQEDRAGPFESCKSTVGLVGERCALVWDQKNTL